MIFIFTFAASKNISSHYNYDLWLFDEGFLWAGWEYMLLNQGSEILALINFMALGPVLSMALSLTSQRNDVKLECMGLSQCLWGFQTL